MDAITLCIIAGVALLGGLWALAMLIWLAPLES